MDCVRRIGSAIGVRDAMLTLFLSAAPEISRGTRALRYTPDRAHDPDLDDGASPSDVAQVYFETLDELEAAASGIEAGAAEAMQVHRFAVPQPGRARRSAGHLLGAYRRTGVDEAECFPIHRSPSADRGDACRDPDSDLPDSPPLQSPPTRWRRLCRCSSAFTSPVRLEILLCRFPAYSGRVTHYAMTTEPVRA